MELINLVFRNLKSRPVRSFLTWLGILVATTSMILFLSFGEGLRKALDSEMQNFGPEIRIVAEGTSSFGAPLPELSPDMLPQLVALKDELGIEDITPLVVMVKGGGFSPSSGFLFYGMNEQTSPRLFLPNVEVAKGRLQPHPDGAVVGFKKAEQNNFEIGKTLRLGREQEVEIVGILEEAGTLSDSAIFVPLTVLQDAMGTKNYGTFLLNLKNDANIEKVSQRLEEEFEGIEAQSMSEAMDFAKKSLRIGDFIRFGISAVALIVGALLIANTIMMSVFERTREFGLMRAIGAKQQFIFSLVLTEALFLALTGGLAGVLLGYIGTIFINVVSVKYVGIALSALTFRLAFFALSVALVLGLLSGLLPARNASRMPVIKALGRA